MVQLVQEILENSKVSQNSKLKVVLLYSLRYEKLPGNLTNTFVETLKKDGISDEKAQVFRFFCSLSFGFYTLAEKN